MATWFKTPVLVAVAFLGAAAVGILVSATTLAAFSGSTSNAGNSFQAAASFGCSGISTFAGTGTSGFSGDGGPATAAQIFEAIAVSFDSSGNAYIGDVRNHRTRKVTPSGTISTFAGTGTAGSAGDGGPATSAQLNQPNQTAFDSAGNIYIADRLNNKVRRISPAGTITTFAGTGVAGSTGDGGPATAAALNDPRGVAVDASDSVYIAEYGGHRIRKVTSGTISTFAGTGTSGSTGDGGAATAARLNTPNQLTFDSLGNLYAVNSFENKVRKITAAGTISTAAGVGGASGFGGDGGLATAAQLYLPSGVAVDSTGNIFIGDYGNHRIRKVNAAGVISTIAGTGVAGFSGQCVPPTTAQLNWPAGLALRGGNLFVADSFNHRIRRITSP